MVRNLKEAAALDLSPSPLDIRSNDIPTNDVRGSNIGIDELTNSVGPQAQ